MKLIATKQGPAAKYDRLHCVRDDGTVSVIDMPRQGVLPHDLVHYVVESGLGFEHGFLGLVAGGADAQFVIEQTHGPGCVDVGREAAQVEAVVEALQTQLWAGAFDGAAFAYGVETACASRGVDVPASLGQARGETLFQEAQALHQRWMAVPPKATLELEFSPRRVSVTAPAVG